MTDGQLLQGFVAHRDEAAFEALVRRHGPMVWGVCQRLLRNHQDAEDAFQATFLVLVRKAAAIASRELLANWLYGVAYRTALKARAANARRQARERQVPAMPEPEAVPQGLWHDLRPLLDQELSRLPDKYRVAIILCDLDGKTRQEAARQLGWPEGTVAGRLARARALLARRLTRQGVVLSGGSLAVVLAQGAASACVPTTLVASTVQAAGLFAAGQAAGACGISTSVAALTEGVVQAMFLTKLKTATALVLGLGAVAAVTSAIAYRVFAGPPGNTEAAARTPTAVQAREQPKTDLERLQGAWVLVTGDMDGAPAPEGYAGNFRAVFTGHKLAFRTRDNQPIARFSREWTIQLDPTAKPKAMDLRSGDQHAPAIYELEGETLKLCGGDTGGKRPTEFKGGPGLLFLVLKREAAAKDGDKP
jgi:RNA polymerase sigma-70 factor (ECF subfamily)